MNLQWIGLAAATSTFFGVWFGHVAVRKIESITANIWLPALVAALGGLTFVGFSLASSVRSISATLGILGITLLWDSFEFLRQQNRVRKGHAPANPKNPRHAYLLAQNPSATTIDWLVDRIPTNHPLTPVELHKIEEGAA